MTKTMNREVSIEQQFEHNFLFLGAPRQECDGPGDSEVQTEVVSAHRCGQ